MPSYKILLREKYYLEHFEYLLAFVRTHYADMLNPRERQFMQGFEQSTHDAQCLLVRLYNRQGIFFTLKNLQYAEINNTAASMHELVALGLLDTTLDTIAANWLDFLHARTRDELSQAGMQLGYIQCKTLSKAALINVLSTIAVNHKDFINYLRQDNPIISLPFKKDYLKLKFMLFGDLSQAMSNFVLHELRGAAPLQFSAKQFSPLFSTRIALEESFSMQQAYLNFKKQQAQMDPATLYKTFMRWPAQQKISTEAAQRTYDKFALKFARHLERAQSLEEALSVYTTTAQPPSRERQVRLCVKLGRHAAATTISENILTNYRNAEEKQFAQDFLDKIKHRALKKAASVYLETAETIQIQSSIVIKPEQAVIDHFKALGYQAYFCENYVWKGLFALLFWDLIYEGNAQYFHQPFQRIPSNLMHGSFLDNRRDQIMQKLALLHDQPRCLAILKNTYAQYANIDNSIINWHPDLFLLIEQCCIFLNPRQLSAILLEMARDWRHNSTGFPDLLIWREQEYQFIEVKSPRDKLSAQQLNWLRIFKEIEVPAKVIRVIFVK